MANPEHVDIVLQEFRAIEKWREKNPGVTLDLCGADLSWSNLGNANLYYSDLSYANLNNANLYKACLIHANLKKADLNEVDLRKARLSNSYLKKASLSEANLNDANLQRSDLSRANIDRANLKNVDLREVNLNDANLREADLTGANLSRASLNRADLRWAILVETNLRDVKLNESNLDHADLTHALLFMTNFNNSSLKEANLKRTELFHTTWIAVDLSQTLGLESVFHHGPSSIGVDSLVKSQGKIPEVFLRGCGLSDDFISYIPSHFAGSIIQFYSCFISYSHEDKSFARRLHDALQGRGIRCWLDEHQLLPGDNIYERIDRGIRVWDKVLLCASKNSLTSGWVDDELKHAFAKEKQLFKDRGCEVLSLIPLNLDGYLFTDWNHPKKNQVLERMAPDFAGWETDNAIFEQQLERVVKALQTDNTGREPEPKPKL